MLLEQTKLTTLAFCNALLRQYGLTEVNELERGYRNIFGECVVARTLRKGGLPALVDRTRIYLIDQDEYIPTIEAVDDFLYYFDCNEYPELDLSTHES